MSEREDSPSAASLPSRLSYPTTSAIAGWFGSGIYIQHPDARYFSVGRVARDQVEDYAARKGVDLAEAERWLSPNLAYEPAPAPRAVDPPVGRVS